MLAWNAEDAGKIIETYKIYEKKSPDAIMERSDTAPYQKVYAWAIVGAQHCSIKYRELQFFLHVFFPFFS